MLEERSCETDGHTKIGATEAANDGEGHSDHTALAIQERTARAARGRLRVVNNFVRQDIANVALRDQGTDQFAPGELGEDEFRIAAGDFNDLFDGIVSGTGEDRVQAGGVTQADQRFAADRSFLSAIQFEDRPLELGEVAVNECEVRILRNLGNP